MTLICDAGAFVALERDDRSMWRRLKAELVAGTPPLTHGGVVAQVWRGGHGRQALLARAFATVEVVALDEQIGRMAGALCGVSRTSDAIDAAVVVLASDNDRIVTSDAADIGRLVAANGRRIDVIAV